MVMWEFYVGLCFVGVAVGVALAKTLNPNLTAKCIFGFHEYYYSHERHGMHFDKDKLVGTKRKIYMCRCGAEKPVEKSDWINT